jgi:hypothetical protein
MAHDRLTPEGIKFFAEIEKLKKLQVRIGYQDDGKMAGERDESGNVVDSKDVTLLDVAMWNELGTVGMPSRPFLRQSIDNHVDAVNTVCKEQLKRLAKGETAEEILKTLGVFTKALVQDTILNGDFAPNAPRTVRQKKSDRPLIDTARMRQSVNYVVVPKE